MGKVRHNYRSRRFISQMTTVLRALQFSLNLGKNENLTQPGAAVAAVRKKPGLLKTAQATLQA